MSHTVDACPACDGTNFSRRTTRPGDAEGEPSTKFRCLACGDEFDEPHSRPPRDAYGGSSLKGLSKRLAEIGEQDYPDGGRR